MLRSQADRSKIFKVLYLRCTRKHKNQNVTAVILMLHCCFSLYYCASYCYTLICSLLAAPGFCNELQKFLLPLLSAFLVTIAFTNC